MTQTSVILDGATYQRLAQAARSRPKQTREQEVEESKRTRDEIEVQGFSPKSLSIKTNDCFLHVG